MTISAKIKALLGRTIRGVPPGCPGCLTADVDLPKFDYCPASALSPVLAASAEPWRKNYITGEQWFRVPLGDGEIQAVADFDDDDDPDFAADDFADDDPDDDPADDDDLDASSTIGQWSEEIDESGFPVDYPQAWRPSSYV